MTTPLVTSLPRPRPPDAAPAQVEIVIPVKDEERDLPTRIRRLVDHLAGSDFPFSALVTIADNGSTAPRATPGRPQPSARPRRRRCRSLPGKR